MIEIECEPESYLGERAAVDTLGAGLQKHLTRQSVHDQRVEAAGPSHHVRLGEAGAHDTLRYFPALR